MRKKMHCRRYVLRADTDVTLMGDLNFNLCWWEGLHPSKRQRAMETEAGTQANFLKCYHFYAYEMGVDIPYDYLHVWYAGVKKRWRKDKKVHDRVIQSMKKGMAGS